MHVCVRVYTQWNIVTLLSIKVYSLPLNIPSSQLHVVIFFFLLLFLLFLLLTFLPFDNPLGPVSTNHKCTGVGTTTEALENKTWLSHQKWMVFLSLNNYLLPLFPFDSGLEKDSHFSLINEPYLFFGMIFELLIYSPCVIHQHISFSPCCLLSLC